MTGGRRTSKAGDLRHHCSPRAYGMRPASGSRCAETRKAPASFGPHIRAVAAWRLPVPAKEMCPLALEQGGNASFSGDPVHLLDSRDVEFHGELIGIGKQEVRAKGEIERAVPEG